MTAETLRYYDRIGLVTPSKTDKNTGYRYYSQAEIVRLNTIKALRSMDLTLSEIRNILEYDDLKKIAEALKQTEAKADKKIAELRDAKNKIRRARNFYESKLYGNAFSDNIFLKEFPRRVILLSDKLSAPTVDNLWNYHRHFYGRCRKKSGMNSRLTIWRGFTNAEARHGCLHCAIALSKRTESGYFRRGNTFAPTAPRTTAKKHCAC